MKKILSFVIAAIMLISVVTVFASCENENDDKPVLNVYTSAGFAPYEYVDENGKVVGVDIDVMNAIGEKLGYKIVVNDIDFNAILNEVEKDVNAVGAAGMTKKPARDEVALASEIYATSVQYIIAPKGAFADGAIVKLEDAIAYAIAQGKGIGVQKGTTGADMVAGAAENTATTAIEYGNAIIASHDIGTSVSAVVIDKMPAQSIASGNANLACWALDAEPESYVLYFNKNATELVTKVNAILKTMIEDGTINQFTINHSGGSK